MSSVLRTIFIVSFIFYAISPLSYTKSAEGSIHYSHAESRLTNLRLFLLEHIFNAASDQAPSESSSGNVLVRKKRVLISSIPDWQLLSDTYLGKTVVCDPPLIVPAVDVAGRDIMVLKPQEIFFSYYSDLSPPSF